MPGVTDVALEANIQRIENASESALDLSVGRTAVVGSLYITTRLSRVDAVTATMLNQPAAGKSFISAYPASTVGGNPTDIVLECYTNAFAVSVISVIINWIAVGEMILG